MERLKTPGMEEISLADALAGAEEERIDEGGGAQMGLADERAQGFGAAQAAHASDGEVHEFSLRALPREG